MARGGPSLARGLAAGECPDEWNCSHLRTGGGGCRRLCRCRKRGIILTNTFRSNRVALAGYGLANRAVELNTLGVEHSLRGAAGRAEVFGSVGPSGKVLTVGEVTVDELRVAFEEQVDAMASAGSLIHSCQKAVGNSLPSLPVAPAAA